MIEKVFNLFIYTDGKIINQLGVVVHDLDGSDDEKMAFLRSAVSSDYKVATTFAVKSCPYDTSDRVFKYTTYLALARAGRSFEVFEEIFTSYVASKSPLSCVTPIVNGQPEIDITSDFNPLYLGGFDDYSKISGGGRMADYLESYMTPEGFNMPELIHNDYFSAIKILFNSRQYVSCMKLVMSFIDTIAFIEFGDVSGGFVQWLKVFSSINRLGITEDQLWELRNSILHMSNLDSRKVLSGKEKRISFCEAESGYIPETNLNIQYFNLKDFIDEIARSLSKWIETYNKNPNKMILFIERYDRVVSDSRYVIKSKK